MAALQGQPGALHLLRDALLPVVISVASLYNNSGTGGWFVKDQSRLIGVNPALADSVVAKFASVTSTPMLAAQLGSIASGLIPLQAKLHLEPDLHTLAGIARQKRKPSTDESRCPRRLRFDASRLPGVATVRIRIGDHEVQVPIEVRVDGAPS
jgi:hypothetical protein